jgi:hypothetical protein
MSPLEHIATPLLICYSFVSAYALCCKVGLLIDKESVQCHYKTLTLETGLHSSLMPPSKTPMYLSVLNNEGKVRFSLLIQPLRRQHTSTFVSFYDTATHSKRFDGWFSSVLTVLTRSVILKLTPVRR